MASIRRISLLAGGATAAALVAAFPAQAEEALTQVATMAGSAQVTTGTEASVEIAEVSPEGAETTGVTMDSSLANESEAAIVTETVELFGETVAPEEVAEVSTVSTPEVDDAVSLSDVLAVQEPVSTDAVSLFEGVDVAQVTEPTTDTQEVAQVTRPLYRGVSPFYVGVGGNIGIIDSDETALGDFAFNIISKISFGPRFSVRPSLQFSEDRLNLALPLTYNFNPIQAGNFDVYPSVGGGIDWGEEVGFLINGGVDIPISRDFTLNGQLNWRVTSDTALGISLGVGYNFPFFFE